MLATTSATRDRPLRRHHREREEARRRDRRRRRLRGRHRRRPARAAGGAAPRRLLEHSASAIPSQANDHRRRDARRRRRQARCHRLWSAESGPERSAEAAVSKRDHASRPPLVEVWRKTPWVASMRFLFNLEALDGGRRGGGEEEVSGEHGEPPRQDWPRGRRLIAVFIARRAAGVFNVDASVKAVVAAATLRRRNRRRCHAVAAAFSTCASTVSTALEQQPLIGVGSTTFPRKWRRPRSTEAAKAPPAKRPSSSPASRRRPSACRRRLDERDELPCAMTQYAPITAACSGTKTMRLKVASALVAHAVRRPGRHGAGEVMTVCVGNRRVPPPSHRPPRGWAGSSADKPRRAHALRGEASIAIPPHPPPTTRRRQQRQLADLEARSFGPKAVSSAKEIEVSADLAGVITCSSGADRACRRPRSRLHARPR